MAENQIDKMRIKHEQILHWLLVNPDRTQNECAEVFGVTPAWLSVVVNSDVFQARWRQLRQMLDANATQVIEAKALGVVAKGLDRLDSLVEYSADPNFVLSTTDKLLGRLGYGGKGVVVQNNTQNNFGVTQAELAEARAVLENQGRQFLTTQPLPQIVDAEQEGEK